MPDSSGERSVLRRVVGVMTGTSLDAIDSAQVEIRGRGLRMSALLVRAGVRPLGEIGDRLRRMSIDEPMRASEIARLSSRLGAEIAEAVVDVAGGRPDLVAVHGQTVCHRPPVSWQLVDATAIAQRVRAPVVFDLRAADLAAGGAGAPITPIADWILFGDAEESRAIVNLGGFCNVTHLPSGAPPEMVRGGDVCACNHVLDSAALTGLGSAYDEGGRFASDGDVHPAALAELCGELEEQREAGRSLGSGDEAQAWAERWGEILSGADLCRTACEGVAASIAAAIGEDERALVAGGGARNEMLVERLRGLAPGPVGLTDVLGVPASSREAMEMAVLGALVEDRVPITLPRVTCRADDVMVGGKWVLP